MTDTAKDARAEIERLTDELLVYLRRRKSGSWSLERLLTEDAYRVSHEGRAVLNVGTDLLTARGPEAVSAWIIGAVKSDERKRKGRKTA